MISTIKAMRSTFNLLLSVVELLIGLSFAVKIFGSDITSSGGLSDYVNVSLGQMGDSFSQIASNTEISGPLAFLILVLGFMIFCSALFILVPTIIQQGKRNAEMESEWK